MAKKKTENIKAAPVLRASKPGGDEPTPTPEQTGTRTYQIIDPWKDRDVVNLVDVKAVDGEITDVKVNGEPAGGGGGEVPTVTFKVINNAGFKVLMYGAYEEWGEINIRKDIAINFNANVTLITSSTGQTNCMFVPLSSANNITTSATGSAVSTAANRYRISGSDAIITITAV